MEPKAVFDATVGFGKLLSKVFSKSKETVVAAPSAPPAIAPVTTISPSVTTFVSGYDSRDLVIVLLCVVIIVMIMARRA